MFGRRPPEALAEGGQAPPTQVAGQRPAATSEPQVASETTTPIPSPVEEPAVEIPEESVSVGLPVQTRPKVDVFNLTRGMSLALGSMVLGFFTVDTYAARRRGLTRLSGHTLAHFGLLLLLLGVTWFLKPGVVL